MGTRGVEMSGPSGIAPAMRVLRADLRRVIGRDTEVCATAEVRGDHRWLGGVPEFDPDAHLLAWGPPRAPTAGTCSAAWCRSGDVVACVSARATVVVDWAPARDDLATTAAIVTAMVCDQQAITDLDRMVEDLTMALRNRSVIDQAIGVIMAQNRCGSREAFGILRAASQHRNEKLRVVASGIVQRMSGAPVDPGGFRARPASRRPEASGRPWPGGVSRWTGGEPAVGPRTSSTRSVFEMTTAREIMTAGAACVGENETLEAAARKMKDLDVGQLPVCGEDGRLKGVVTDRDIVVKCLADGGDPRSTTAGKLAEGKPVTIGADDSIEEAIATMVKHQVRRLPVIDGHDLVGMLSQADIARSYPEDRVGELVELISRD